MKLREMGTIIIVAFVLLSIAIGALSRLDNMKWDDVKPFIEKQKEKEAKEKEEREKPWYKKAFSKLI